MECAPDLIIPSRDILTNPMAARHLIYTIIVVPGVMALLVFGVKFPRCLAISTLIIGMIGIIISESYQVSMWERDPGSSEAISVYVKLFAVVVLGMIPTLFTQNTQKGNHHVYGIYSVVIVVVNMAWTLYYDFESNICSIIRSLTAILLMCSLVVRAWYTKDFCVLSNDKKIPLFGITPMLWVFCYSIWDILFVFANFDIDSCIHNFFFIPGVYYMQSIHKRKRQNKSDDPWCYFLYVRVVTLGVYLALDFVLGISDFFKYMVWSSAIGSGKPCIEFLFWVNFVLMIVVIFDLRHAIELKSHCRTKRHPSFCSDVM